MLDTASWFFTRVRYRPHLLLAEPRAWLNSIFTAVVSVCNSFNGFFARRKIFFAFTSVRMASSSLGPDSRSFYEPYSSPSSTIISESALLDLFHHTRQLQIVSLMISEIVFRKLSYLSSATRISCAFLLVITCSSETSRSASSFVLAYGIASIISEVILVWIRDKFVWYKCLHKGPVSHVWSNQYLIICDGWSRATGASQKIRFGLSYKIRGRRFSEKRCMVS